MFACVHHKFLFAARKTRCSVTIRLQNILYHVCFDNTDSLPGNDDDDDDTGDISTCHVEATHDEVAEI